MASYEDNNAWYSNLNFALQKEVAQLLEKTESRNNKKKMYKLQSRSSIIKARKIIIKTRMTISISCETDGRTFVFIEQRLLQPDRHNDGQNIHRIDAH